MTVTLPPCTNDENAVLPHLDRPVVLVGLMGAGKTKVGGILARALNIPFADSDMEVERAAGMSVADIFDLYGEHAFRDCEMKVLARLVETPVKVVATGGGGFMNTESRARIKEKAISIWLRADLDVLLERVRRGGHRPLLRMQDPEKVLRDLMEQRYPAYAQADMTVDSNDGAPQDVAGRLVAMIDAYIKDKT